MILRDGFLPGILVAADCVDTDADWLPGSLAVELDSGYCENRKVLDSVYQSNAKLPS